MGCLKITPTSSSPSRSHNTSFFVRISRPCQPRLPSLPGVGELLPDLSVKDRALTYLSTVHCKTLHDRVSVQITSSKRTNYYWNYPANPHPHLLFAIFAFQVLSTTTRKDLRKCSLQTPLRITEQLLSSALHARKQWLPLVSDSGIMNHYQQTSLKS